MKSLNLFCFAIRNLITDENNETEKNFYSYQIHNSEATNAATLASPLGYEGNYVHEIQKNKT